MQSSSTTVESDAKPEAVLPQSSGSQQTWTVNFFAPVQLQNQIKGAWGKSHAGKQQWREAGKLLAKSQKIPSLRDVRLEVIHYHGQKTGRLPDLGACMPSLKSFVDGITLAGVWPDDSFQYIQSITFNKVLRASQSGLGLIIYGTPAQ